MKKTILITFLFLNISTLSAAKIDRVIDGDTFVIHAPNPPKELLQDQGRLLGIDTPESTKRFAKCEKERLLGLKAKEFSQKFVENQNVEIVYHSNNDKYGRYLISVFNKNKQDLAEELVRNGLAVFYDGGLKSKDWCD